MRGCLRLSIALFELRRRGRLPSTWVYATVFLATAFFLTTASAGVFGIGSAGGPGKLYVNSPSFLHSTLSLFSLLGMLVSGAIMGRAVQQDFEHNISSLFFTRPISRLDYLGGRFLGGLLTCLAILISAGVGAWLATVMPWMPAERLMPHASVLAYVQPYFLVLVPNLLFTGALFFCTAALTRRMAPVYMTSVLMLLGYTLAVFLIQGLDLKATASLLDPFGGVAIDNATKYWTPTEQNRLFLPMDGLILINRLLWMGLGAVISIWTALRFSFSRDSGAEPLMGRDHPDGNIVPLRRVKPDFSGHYWGRIVPALAWLHLRDTVRNIYFSIMVLAGVLTLGVVMVARGFILDNPTYPVTSQMISLAGPAFSGFLLAILTFSSGELIWREREHNFAQVYDVLPHPVWVTVASKTLALLWTAVLLLTVATGTSIAIQLASGYHHLEPGLYLRWTPLVRPKFGLR